MVVRRILSRAFPASGNLVSNSLLEVEVDTVAMTVPTRPVALKMGKVFLVLPGGKLNSNNSEGDLRLRDFNHGK